MSSGAPCPVAASVIVPVYNGQSTLGACLQALAAQTADPNSYEVIVVDDGSTDGSAEVAARHGAMVIRQEHRGAAAARNRGAQQAQGPVLLFTDADCEPWPNWIEQMMAPFADPEVVGVKGVYRTRQRSPVARFTQAEYEEKYDVLARSNRIDFIDTYSAAYRRQVFLETRGFDTSFPATTMEDQELSYRLAKRGHKLVFAPAACVYHQHPATMWHYARRKAKLGRWKVRVHLRYPSKALRDSYTPWTQKAQLVLLPLCGASAVAAALGLVPWLVVAGLAGLGFLSTVPLLRKAVRFGWPVVLIAPWIVLVRALALDLGVAWGAVIQLFCRAAETVEPW
jgi:cellulose synthase/poly-beta-1,6-N-acetylglucosamine synthase-like glycosyltransferase